MLLYSEMSIEQFHYCSSGAKMKIDESVLMGSGRRMRGVSVVEQPKGEGDREPES